MILEIIQVRPALGHYRPRVCYHDIYLFLLGKTRKSTAEMERNISVAGTGFTSYTQSYCSGEQQFTNNSSDETRKTKETGHGERQRQMAGILVRRVLLPDVDFPDDSARDANCWQQVHPILDCSRRGYVVPIAR